MILILSFMRGLKTSNYAMIVYLLLSLFLYVAAIFLVWSTRSFELREDRVFTDTPQVTKNGRYEYHLELVNLFRGTAESRVVIRDLETGNNNLIQIEFGNIGRSPIALGRSGDFHWIYKETTDVDGIYRLSTTTDFLLNDFWVFEVNMQT